MLTMMVDGAYFSPEREFVEVRYIQYQGMHDSVMLIHIELDHLLSEECQWPGSHESLQGRRLYPGPI